MDIKYLGFTIGIERQNSNIEDFIQYISNSEKGYLHFNEAESNNEIRLYMHNTIDSDFYQGLVVTIKDQQKFCKFTDEGAEIEVENLEGDNKLIDFNFFVINKSNHIGLFQHYHHSCALSKFMGFFKRYFKNMTNAQAELAIDLFKANNDGEISKNKIKAIRLDKYDWLNMSQLIKHENLQSVLLQCEKIKSFEYDITYLDESNNVAQPLSRFVEKKQLNVRFKRVQSVSEIASSLSRMVQDLGIRQGKVYAEDQEGNSFPIQVINTPDCFGIDDYDRLVSRLNGLVIHQFYSNSFYDILIEKFALPEYSNTLSAELETA